MSTIAEKSKPVAKKILKLTPRRANDPVHIKLRRLMQSKCITDTDAQVAAKAGMDPRAFSRLMLGHVPDPRLSTLRSILIAIGSNLAEFEQA